MTRKRIEMSRDKSRIKKHAIMDPMDKFVFGPLNYLERIFGAIKKLKKSSKGGAFGKTVQIVVPRIDKGGDIGLRQCIDHLEQHGIPCFTYQHDDMNFYFEVRETQYSWAKWMLNNGEGLRSPKRKWSDGPKPKVTKPAAKRQQPKQSLMDRIF